MSSKIARPARRAGPSPKLQRTRALLLDRAMRLVGPGRLPSVAEVAMHAGVSRATAYRYFPSRSKLISAVVEESLGPVRRFAPRSDDGLELSLIARDVKASPGHVLMNLAARRLPADRISAFRLPPGERIVAVYALHPFGAISDSPIGVRIPSTLPAGTPVKFWAIGELDGGLLAPVAGRATGQHVATAPDTGITVLTYLLISR